VGIESIFLELTTRCNLSCIKCPNKFFLEKNDINKDILNFILFKSLKNYSGKVIVATGEPTLNKNGLVTLHKWSLLNRDRKVIIFTNGTLLHTLSEELLSNPQITYIVSLDGIRRHTIRKLQPDLNIQVLKSNLQKLRKRNLPTNFFINFTLHKLIVNEIIDIFKFASILHLKELFFTPLLNFYFPNKNLVAKYQLDDIELKNLRYKLSNLSKLYRIKIKIGSNNKCKSPRPIFHIDGSVSYCEGTDGLYTFRIQENILDIIDRSPKPLHMCKTCFKKQQTYFRELPPRLQKLTNINS